MALYQFNRSALLAAAFLATTSTSQSVFLPVSNPAVVVSGRYAVNADGSYGFDWPGVSFFFNVAGTSTVRAIVNGTQITRMATSVSYPALGLEFAVSSTWIGPGFSPDNSYLVAAALDPNRNYTIRFTHDLSAGQIATWYSGVPMLLYGFELDAGAMVLPAGPTLSRRLEYVGDSITVGAGAEGAPPGQCPYSSFLEHNTGTWDRFICANFSANCSVVAWSGKGLYANANGQGELMPEYFRQTLGAGNYTTDWDFKRFTPEAVIINLGTNDFGSPNRHAPGFAQNFTNYAIAFMSNLTTIYYGAANGGPGLNLPIFLAQGTMNNGDELYGCLASAIAYHNSHGGNAHYLDMRNLTQDGCGGHPGPIGHRQMADAAIPQIAAVLGW